MRMGQQGAGQLFSSPAQQRAQKRDSHLALSVRGRASGGGTSSPRTASIGGLRAPTRKLS